MTVCAAALCPGDSLRPAVSGSLGRAPTARQSTVSPAEAIASAGLGGPDPSWPLNPSSTTAHYQDIVPMVHATVGVRPSPHKPKAWIPTIAWTIGAGVDQAKINPRLTSRVSQPKGRGARHPTMRDHAPVGLPQVEHGYDKGSAGGCSSAKDEAVGPGEVGLILLRAFGVLADSRRARPGVIGSAILARQAEATAGWRVATAPGEWRAVALAGGKSP